MVDVLPDGGQPEALLPQTAGDSAEVVTRKETGRETNMDPERTWWLAEASAATGESGLWVALARALSLGPLECWWP